MGPEEAREPVRADPAARIVLGVALAAAAVLLFYCRHRLGFLADDLIFLNERSLGGIGDLLDPHNEHIVILQAALYRLSWTLFGPTNAIPVHVVGELAFLLGVVAYFVWVRERVGEMAAAISSIPILFLGTGYQDLISAFQVGYTGSMLGGLVALVALDRGGRLSRPVACVGLVVAVATSSLGLPFLAGAAVQIYLRAGLRRAVRDYVLLVPAAIYVAWFIGWGSTAESYLSFANAVDAPFYLAESVKSAVMSVSGLHRVGSPAGDVAGWILTVALVGFAGHRLVTERRLPPAFLVALATGLAFWLLSSLSQIPGTELRSPDQSRYQYPGAVFLLMILAGAFSGIRPNRLQLSVLAGLAAISVACGVGLLWKDLDGIELGADRPKAAMTALDFAGDEADPSFELYLVPYFVRGNMSQDRFRELQERYGRAGWSEAEARDQDSEARDLIDAYSVEALGIEVSGGAASGGVCRTLAPGAGDRRLLAELESGEVTVTPFGSSLDLTAGRFSDGAPVDLGTAKPGETSSIVFPDDAASEPWRLTSGGEGRVRVCVTR